MKQNQTTTIENKNKVNITVKNSGDKSWLLDDTKKRRLLPQHSVATLLRHCFQWLQHCSNIAALCCAKNRRCESSRVTSP